MTEFWTIFLSFTLPCLMTTLGALLIFFFDKASKIVNLIAIGVSAGIMLSASIWSLLVPALEKADSWGKLAFVPLACGFVLGCVFLVFLDVLCSKMSKNVENSRKPLKFFLAMVIHNIPEGLAVGFAVGTAIAMKDGYLSAFLFSLGIALQNFPEGLATAIPLQNFTQNRKKSFSLAFLSGIVEPICAILGCFLATFLSSLLPWLLSFSAGAMIFVVIDELLPELHRSKNSLGTILFVVGFVLMMLLDLAL